MAVAARRRGLTLSVLPGAEQAKNTAALAQLRGGVRCLFRHAERVRSA
ncbi:hypothetical protein [Amycolatopsis sp. lyj-112]